MSAPGYKTLSVEQVKNYLERQWTSHSMTVQLATLGLISHASQDEVEDLLKILGWERSVRLAQRNRQVEKLFNAIKHGDAEHQAWLKNKIVEHFNRID
jgi:hypothetical protein